MNKCKRNFEEQKNPDMTDYYKALGTTTTQLGPTRVGLERVCVRLYADLGYNCTNSHKIFCVYQFKTHHGDIRAILRGTKSDNLEARLLSMQVQLLYLTKGARSLSFNPQFVHIYPHFLQMLGLQRGCFQSSCDLILVLS